MIDKNQLNNFLWLKNLETNQQNQLLKEQTADYRAFVGQLIKGGSIMAKNFFVVVPFSLAEVVGGIQKDTQQAKQENWQAIWKSIPENEKPTLAKARIYSPWIT